MRLRTAARIDSNQREIVDGLRKYGVQVYCIGKPVDLLCAYRGANYLLEIKDSKKPQSARQLTAAQIEFFKTWNGPVSLATNLVEALFAVGIML